MDTKSPVSELDRGGGQQPPSPGYDRRLRHHPRPRAIAKTGLANRRVYCSARACGQSSHAPRRIARRFMDSPFDAALIHLFNCFQSLNLEQIGALATHLEEVRLSP